MADIGFIRSGDWPVLKKALDVARTSEDAKKEIKSANGKAAMYIRGQIRARIRGGTLYSANAALTIMIKGSSKPLVHGSDLFNSVATQSVDWQTEFVGILRGGVKSPNGDDMANIGEIVHEGITIRVTDKMRGLFFALYRYAQGQLTRDQLGTRADQLVDELKGRVTQIRPLKESTRVIVIPPRHFISDVFKDEGVIKRCNNIWRRAARTILTGKKQPEGPGGTSG